MGMGKMERPMRTGSGGATAFTFRLSAGILALAAALMSCRSDHEFDSPYLPGNPGYAGDDWTRDRDGNGIADSLDKYTPGCRLPPAQCLENAQVISQISPLENGLDARNMLLWIGDSAQSPILVWKPAEGALRGYRLTSSDSSVVRVKSGKVQPIAEGSAQISVTVPGMDRLNTSFIAKVATDGNRVEAVTVPDMVLEAGRDTLPPVSWQPSDARFKEYSLASDRPGVALVVGPAIRGVFPGKASVTLVTMDGARRTAFSVTVNEAEQAIYASNLVAEPMFLVKDAPAEAPILTWIPANATDKRYHLVLVEDSKVVAVSADSQKIIPESPGAAQVLVMSQNGLLAREFLVTVSAQSVPVTGIMASDLNLVLGSDPVPPKITWIPSEATNRKFSLSTSDVTVALPSSGKVEPMGMGAADFTITSDDGGFNAVFRVTVGRPDTAVHVDSVSVSPISLAVGDERRISPTWYPTDAGNRTFTLSSGDPEVVQPAGESLKALKAGSATVRLTAADGGRTADFKVTVYVPNIPVQMVTADSMSIYIGKDASPTITWSPANASDLSYGLASSDTTIASIITVAGSQRVLGKAVGIAKVTLKSSGPATTIFPVLVNALPVKLTFISAANFTMNLGDAPKDPALSFSPSNATDKTYKLGSPSGTTIINVSGNRVTPVGAGKAPLIITPNDNPAIAVVCTVTVAALVNSVSAKDPDTLRVGNADKDVTPNLTWLPANASNKEFALKSNDTNLVKISANGKAYKGVGTSGGKATVVVKALDGSGKADTFSVVVQIPVTKVEAKNYTMKAGDTTVYVSTPLFTWTPANASNKNWHLQYLYPLAFPSPSSFVTILNGWQLRAGAAGSAQLTVTSLDNPALKDTFTVTVIQPVTGISAAAVTMRLGDADVVPVVSVLPANAVDKGYTLVSGNTAVATVVANKIHSVASGTATFTIRSTYDSTKTGTFAVTVYVPVASVAGADMTLRVGEAAKDPVLTWLPANATNKAFSMTTAFPGLIGISANKLTGLAAGTGTVVVVAADGNKMDTFTVVVTQPVISISVADMTILKDAGDKDPVITWHPANATNKAYTLTGGNSSVATVSSNRIHPAGGGTAWFIVTTADGAKVDTFSVTIQVPVTGIQGDGFVLRIGDPDETPNVTVSPSDATNKGWYLVSGDTDNATIVGGTKIHAVSRGNATIYVISLENEKITDSFIVDVRSSLGF